MTSVGDAGTDPEGAVGALGVEVAAEQGRALAHADQPVTAAGAGRAAGRRGVGDGELERRVAERELDPGAARSVAGRVRQRLLQDPVGGLVGGAAQRPRRARRCRASPRARPPHGGRSACRATPARAGPRRPRSPGRRRAACRRSGRSPRPSAGPAPRSPAAPAASDPGPGGVAAGRRRRGRRSR